MQILKGSKYLFSRIAFLTVLMFVLAVALAVAPAGAATTFGFTGIVTEDSLLSDIAIGEAQLFVDVTEVGADQVSFRFTNVGTSASSICDVYFDDGSLLGIVSIDNSSTGVSFTQLANPGNLPGGNEADPSFVTTAGFSADSDPEVQPNGVNPGEFLGILFDLQDDRTFSHVLTELENGELRIGIHVQGFDSGGSESFINNNNPVPIPASVLLLGSGLIGVAGFKRKIAK